MDDKDLSGVYSCQRMVSGYFFSLGVWGFCPALPAAKRMAQCVLYPRVTL